MGDTHTRKALEKVAAVAFCFEARVKDGDHAAVSSAAYKTSDPLFERDHGLRHAVIKKRTPAVLIDEPRTRGDDRI